MPAFEIIFYGSLSLIALLASAISKDDDWTSSVGCTGMLMISWAVNTSLWMLASLKFWAITTDGFLAMLTVLIYAITGKQWIIVLSMLFAIDVVLDGFNLLGLLVYHEWAVIENLIFVSQLVLASSPGWFAALSWRSRNRAIFADT